MKITILIFCLFIVYSISFGQDMIIKNNGDTVMAKVTRSISDKIEFIYPNEDLINELYKKQVKKIVFSSGRTEVITAHGEVKKINGENDWEKVVIVYDKKDVDGLTKVKTVSKSSMWGGSLGSNLGYNKVIDKLKKEAAKNKCSIVLIVDNPSKHSAAMGGGVKLVAEIYQ